MSARAERAGRQEGIDSARPRRPGTPWPLLLLIVAGGVAFVVGRTVREAPEPPAHPAAEAPGATPPSARVPEPPPEPAPRDRVFTLRLVDGRGDAVVAAWAIAGGDGGGPPVRARSDGLGLVRLRVPPRIADHAPLLVVAGERGGVTWRPLPQESGFLGEVRLGEAVSSRGTLHLPDGSPAARTALRFRHVALLGDADGRASALFRELVDAGRPLALADSEVDPLGRFAVAGLDPGVYLVESRLPGAGGFERLFLASHRGSLVELVRGGGALELTVEGLLAELVLFDRDFRPVLGPEWQLEGIDADGEAYQRSFRAPADADSAEVWLPPSQSLRARGSRSDLAPSWGAVDLEQEAAGVVRLEVESPGLPGLALVRPILVAGDGSMHPFLWTLEQSVDGSFRPVEPPLRPTDPEWIGPLDPGRYRLTLTVQGARHPLAPEAQLPLAPVPVVFTVAPGQARRLEVPAPPNRRLVLEVEPGAVPIVAARLFAGGLERTLSFVPEGERLRRSTIEAGGTYLAFETLPTDASEVALEHPSGRTTHLELPPGFDDVRRRVSR